MSFCGDASWENVHAVILSVIVDGNLNGLILRGFSGKVAKALPFTSQVAGSIFSFDLRLLMGKTV